MVYTHMMMHDTLTTQEDTQHSAAHVHVCAVYGVTPVYSSNGTRCREYTSAAVMRSLGSGHSMPSSIISSAGGSSFGMPVGRLCALLDRSRPPMAVGCGTSAGQLVRPALILLRSSTWSSSSVSYRRYSLIS